MPHMEFAIRLLYIFLFLFPSTSLAKHLFKCKNCASEELLKSNAFGIELAPDYFTCAMKYVNGSLVQLAKVDTSDNYKSLMQRWMLETSSSDLKPQEPLVANPISSDAHIIYEALTELTLAVSAKYPGTELLLGGIAIPVFITNDQIPHINQALQKAGLIPKVLDYDLIPLFPNDLAAIYASNHDLCLYHVHPHDDNCKSVDYGALVFDALVLDYSTTALTASWQRIFGRLNSKIGGFVDADLGASNKPPSPSPSGEADYWLTLQQRISDFIHSHEASIERPPAGETQVTFSGELSLDASFTNVVSAAVKGTRFEIGKAKVFKGAGAQCDAIFMTAGSVARQAKGQMDAPEPSTCTESVKCQDLREKVYQEALSGEQSVREEL